ncbi:putative DNA topoisomerase [Helianthus anomalus]
MSVGITNLESYAGNRPPCWSIIHLKYIHAILCGSGVLQFPTLGFLVERHQEIHCSRPIDKDTTKFSLKRGGLFDYSSAKLLYEMCVEKGCARVRVEKGVVVCF